MIPFDTVALVEVSSLGPPIPGTGYGTPQRVWNLNDNIAYALQSYAPAIAPLRRSRLEGDGAYAEVEDEIVVTVIGSSATTCAANYDALFQVLDQAAQWWAGEAENAIQLRISVRCGALETLAACVLGPAPGTSPGSVSPAWDDSFGAYAIRDVSLRFGRRGALLAATPDTASANATSGEIITLTWTAEAANPSPVAVQLTTSAASGIGSGYVLASTAGNITIVNATAASLALPAGVTSVVDATNRAGSVLNYAPADELPRTIGNYVSNLPNTTRRAYVFATVRVLNSGTNQFTLYARLRNFSTSGILGSTSPVLIPNLGGGVGSPVQVIYLGQLDNPGEVWPDVDLVLQNIGTNTNNLRIGQLYFVGDQGDATAILAASNIEYLTTASLLTISPRLLTDPTPQVVSRFTGAPNNVRIAPAAFGDRVFQQRGTQMAILPLLINNWRMVDGGATPVTVTATATRNVAYRVPQ